MIDAFELAKVARKVMPLQEALEALEKFAALQQRSFAPLPANLKQKDDNNA